MNRTFIWKALALALLVGAMAGISFFRVQARIPLVDDAFIFMRYARHVAQGSGFVWNIGERPVEGFSSFLYLLLLVAVEALRLPQVAASEWIGLALAVTTVGLTWRLSAQINPRHGFWDLLALYLFGLSPVYLRWSLSGMESALYALMLIICVSTYISCLQRKMPPWVSGVAFALAALTRPEAVAIFGVTIVFEMATNFVAHKKLLDHRTFVLGATFAALVGPFNLWRWLHFGYPFPNTYYAKTGGGLTQIRGGADYLVYSLKQIFGGSSSVLAPLPFFLHWRTENAKSQIYLGVVIVTSWLVTILTGGDHFNDARFLTPTLPLVFCLAGIGLSTLATKFARHYVWKIAIGGLLFIAVIHQYIVAFPFFYTGEIAKGWNATLHGPELDTASINAGRFLDWEEGFVLMGQTLKRIGQPGDSIAAVPVGAIAYYSDMTVIDMVGVADPVIAHQPFDPEYTTTWRPGHDKGDGHYILSRAPTYIQLIDYLTAQSQAEPGDSVYEYKSVAEIWASAEFHTYYEFYPVQTGNGWYYNLYRRIKNGSR